MVAIVFALLAFLGWGSGDVVAGFISRKIGGYSTTFWQYVFSFLITSIYVPFALADLSKFDQTTLLWIIGLNLLSTVPVVALYEGIRVGNAALAGTISAAFASLTVVLSVLFLGDHLSLPQALAIVIIFMGIVLSSLELKSFNWRKAFTDKAVPYALVAMIGWGVLFTFIRIPVRQVGWFWPSYLGVLALPVLWIFMHLRNIKIVGFKSRRILIFSLLSSLFLNVAIFSYNFAIIQGQTSIVAPIAGSYPVLFVVLSRLVFKDKITRQQLSGIVITLLGIVFLSFLSR